MQLSEYFSTQQLRELKIPKYKRTLKKCDDFILCVNSGDAGYIGGGEHPALNYTLYLYAIKGKSITHIIKKGDGPYGTPFEYETIIHDNQEGKLIDISPYLNSYGVFEAIEDFYYIGFNTLDKKVKWEGRLIVNGESSLIIENPNSYFVCLNGEVSINDKKFKRTDYASTIVGKEYQINIKENGALGLFTKLN